MSGMIRMIAAASIVLVATLAASGNARAQEIKPDEVGLDWTEVDPDDEAPVEELTEEEMAELRRLDNFQRAAFLFVDAWIIKRIVPVGYGEEKRIKAGQIAAEKTEDNQKIKTEWAVILGDEPTGLDGYTDKPKRGAFHPPLDPTHHKMGHEFIVVDASGNPLSLRDYARRVTPDVSSPAPDFDELFIGGVGIKVSYDDAKAAVEAHNNKLRESMNVTEAEAADQLSRIMERVPEHTWSEYKPIPKKE